VDTNPKAEYLFCRISAICFHATCNWIQTDIGHCQKR